LTNLLAIIEGRRDEEVLRAVLERGKQLGIRQITFEFLRRSGAVCTEGPEIAYLERQRFDKVILLWDHADSPYADRNPNKAQGIVQAKLNERSLRNCSKAIAINPELEIWLLQDKDAVAKVLETNIQQVDQWILEWWQRLARKDIVVDDNLLSLRKVDLQHDDAWTVVAKLPKEALDWVCRRAKMKPDAELLGEIARCADLRLWQQCKSFRLLVRTLRKWFQ